MSNTGTRIPDEELKDTSVNPNEQAVAEMMCGGVLHQPFLLSAISEYTKMVIQQPMPEDDGTVQLVDPKEWKKVAYDIRSILIKHGYYPQEGQ